MIFDFMRRLFGGNSYDLLIWKVAYFEGRQGTNYGVESFIVNPSKRERELYDRAYKEGSEARAFEDRCK